MSHETRLSDGASIDRPEYQHSNISISSDGDEGLAMPSTSFHEDRAEDFRKRIAERVDTIEQAGSIKRTRRPPTKQSTNEPAEHTNSKGPLQDMVNLARPSKSSETLTKDPGSMRKLGIDLFGPDKHHASSKRVTECRLSAIEGDYRLRKIICETFASYILPSRSINPACYDS